MLLGKQNRAQLVRRDIELHIHTMNSRFTFPVAASTFPFGLIGIKSHIFKSKPGHPNSPHPLLHTWHPVHSKPHCLYLPSQSKLPVFLTWTGTTASQLVSVFPPSYTILCTEASKKLLKSKLNQVTPEFKTFRGSPPPPLRLKGNILTRPMRPYLTWPRPHTCYTSGLIASHSPILNCISIRLALKLWPKFTRPQELCPCWTQARMISPDMCLWSSLPTVYPWPRSLDSPLSSLIQHVTLLLSGISDMFIYHPLEYKFPDSRNFYIFLVSTTMPAR